MPEQKPLFPLAYLPNWYPGETLFSLASRYHKLSGNALASSTCMQLFGSARAGTQHDFPCRIDDFVLRTGALLGTETEIIRRHTILPYYLPFRSQCDEADAIASMRGPTIGSLKYHLGILTSRFRANHPLKACPECMAVDINSHATAYWHLAHQYPGAWSCDIHNVPLRQSTEKSTGVGRFLWHLPEHALLIEPGDKSDNRKQLHERKKLCEGLTKIVCNYADLADGFRFDLKGLLQTYTCALQVRGFGSTNGSLNYSEIGAAYCSALVPLRTIPEFSALPSNTAEATSQVSRLLRAPRSGTHPLRHLLFILWLFGDWDSFMRAYKKNLVEPATGFASTKGSGELKAAPKNIDPRRVELFLLIQQKTCSISEAAKRVGIDTTTAMVWAAQEGVATQRRPKILKPQIREKLIADLRNGHDKTVVAERYEISVQTITTTLRTEVGLHQEWLLVRGEGLRRDTRAKFNHLLTKNPNVGIKAVRALSPAVYAWLYRNDRGWLDDCTKQLTLARTNNVKVDWDGRDAALSNKVLRAGLKIQERKPSHRIFLWQLYQELPELKAKLDVIGRLPLTSKAIKVVIGGRRKDNRSKTLF